MKQKRQLVVLIALLVIAGAVWGWYFRRNQTVAPTETASGTQGFPPLLAVANPQIRFDEIEKARRAEYKSTGRNIFSVTALPQTPHNKTGDPPIIAWTSPCGVAVGPCPPAPPPPPKLPPNVKCFGYGTGPKGTSRRVFFHDTNGDDVYIVNEGQLLLNRYRILKIGNDSLEFEEVSSGRRGTAPCEEQQPGPSA